MKNFIDDEIKEIAFFIDTGLTKNQARIYQTLSRRGKATVKQISKSSKVAREQIYRVCPKLMELGLIKKIITSPIRFEALPIEEGITILINRKILQISKLEKEAVRLVTTIRRFHEKKAIANNHTDFEIIPKKEAFKKRVINTINGAQKSISIMTSMKRHQYALFIFHNAIKNALSKRVKFRVIVGGITEEIPKIAKKFEKHPFTTVKYISYHPPAITLLVDDSKGFVIVKPKAMLDDSSALKIENASLLELLKDYFEYVWNI